MREPEHTTVLSADVVVVGAGPAGLTLAHELAMSGLHVTVLEAGSASPPPGGVDVTSTTNVGLPYSPATTRSSGVGGTSLRWNIGTPLGPGFVRLKELDELDFERREACAASGWPITRSVLEPHYRRARALIGLPPADAERDVAVVGDVERRVYSFGSALVFTQTLPALLRAHPRVRLFTECTMTDIRTGDAADRVTSLTCRTERDGELTVEGKVYVLAAGALENARLLLASTSREPAGLGNRQDHVGRYFMEHPHYLAGVVVPLAGRELRGAAAAWDVTVRNHAVEQSKYALAPDVLRREGVLNGAYKVQRHSGEGPPAFGLDGSQDRATVDAFSAARSVLRNRDVRRISAAQLAHLAIAAPALAAYAIRRLTNDGLLAPTAGQRRPEFRLRVMAEQEPSPKSRLRLTAEPDRFGVPKAELDWRLTSVDLDSMVRGERMLAPGLEKVLGGRVLSVLGEDGVPEPGVGEHHMGTTRMSAQPTSGVVDEDCRVHGVSNLYVAGSSVFPTGGAANPTLTIVALAARLAAHLAASLASRTPSAHPARSVLVGGTGFEPATPSV